MKVAVLGILMVLIASSLMVVLSPTVSAESTTPVWQQGTPMPESIEQASVVANSTGTIFVIGGFSNSTSFMPLNTTWSYDTTTNVWTKRADMPVGVRGAAVANAPDGRIFVFGGYNSTIRSTIQCYDPSTDTWSIPMMTLYDPVWGAQAVYLPSERCFYLIGGELTDGSVSKEVQWVGLSMTYVSKYIGDPGQLPYPRECGSLTLSPDGSKLWYFGGIDNSRTAQSTIYQLDPDAGTWSLIGYMPEQVAAQGVIKGADGLYYLYGGGNNNYNNAEGYDLAYCFNPYSNYWLSIPRLDQPTKYLGAVATTDGRIWAIGGGNMTTLNNVQSLQVLTYTVTAPSAVNTGEPFLVKMTITAPFASPMSQFGGMAYIQGADGTTFGQISFNGVSSNPAAFEMEVPQSASSGAYLIRIVNIQVYYTDTGYTDLAAKSLPITVTALPTVSDQMDALKAQITSLQQNLLQTQTELASVRANGNTTAAEVSALQTQMMSLQQNLSKTQTTLASIRAGDNVTAVEVSALQTQIGLLQTQLNESHQQLAALQSDNEDLSSTLDGKADSTIALMTMVFALIAVILVAIMLVVVLKKK